MAIKARGKSRIVSEFVLKGRDVRGKQGLLYLTDESEDDKQGEQKV